MSQLCCAETVPIRTVNRQCSSGLQAVADVAAAIRAGFYDIGKENIPQREIIRSTGYSPPHEGGPRTHGAQSCENGTGSTKRT